LNLRQRLDRVGHLQGEVVSEAGNAPLRVAAQRDPRFSRAVLD
jgi:hypothetical protein